MFMLIPGFLRSRLLKTVVVLVFLVLVFVFSQLAQMTDASCWFDFSASGMVCQARMLAASGARHTGVVYFHACGFGGKACGYLVQKGN